jgi:hypothetical protein
MHANNIDRACKPRNVSTRCEQAAALVEQQQHMATEALTRMASAEELSHTPALR